MEISSSDLPNTYQIMERWEDIGIQLDIADEELAAIRRKHTKYRPTMGGEHLDYVQSFRDMIRVWIKQVNPPPTWSKLVKALERLNIVHKLANLLRSKYCGTCIAWWAICMKVLSLTRMGTHTLITPSTS